MRSSAGGPGATAPDSASPQPPRSLVRADLPAVAALLDTVVGAGFSDLSTVDERVSFAIDGPGDRLVGVVTAALRPPSACIDDDAVGRACREALGGELPKVLLHVRDLAVDPAWRRRGVASALMRACEGGARGAGAALVYAWLPAGDPAPPSVPLYRRLGYATAIDLPGFFADWSRRAGARCPVCGAPPCRCGVSAMVKRLMD